VFQYGYEPAKPLSEWSYGTRMILKNRALDHFPDRGTIYYKGAVLPPTSNHWANDDFSQFLRNTSNAINILIVNWNRDSPSYITTSTKEAYILLATPKTIVIGSPQASYGYFYMQFLDNDTLYEERYQKLARELDNKLPLFMSAAA
jgi:hypothetical protein